MADSRTAELILKVKTMGADAIEAIGNSFETVAEIAVAAFAAISAVIVKSIDEYAEAEKASKELSQAMVNQGIYSKELKAAYDEQAKAIQQLTLYGDDQVTSAQAILQSYLGQTKISRELINATLDLATAKKIDLNTAAELVGKSIGTETNALSRNGIEVTANASQQQKLGEVLKGIEGRWAGQAEAAASGLGALGQLKNAVGDLFEALGERVAPVVVLFANKLKALATDSQRTGAFLDGFVEVLRILTRGGSFLVTVFESLSHVIGVSLGTALGAASQLLEGKFKQAFETVKQGAKDMVQIVPDTYDRMTERLNEIDQAFLASKQENLQKEEELIKQSNAKKAQANAEFAASEAAKKLELDIQQQQIDMQLLEANEENRARVQLQARIKAQEQILKTTTDAQKKLAAQQEIYNLNELQKQAIIDQKTVENRKATLATIATLQNSSNKELAMIGKAAAITQIAIETPVAISRALAAFPPPYNFVAAGLVGTAMAAQAANIAGVQLAEGGIVRARPGGIQATIGEGGQDEAVIPLDRAGEFGFGGGGNVTVIFQGPVMGDESQAREFALAVDRELLKLRQNNESVSFDRGVV